MNFARIALAAVVSWIVYLGVSFVVHTVLLRDMYLRHLSSMRPETDQNAILPIGFVFALVGFFAFAYAYAKGYEGGRGAQEGLRFGVLVGILICCFRIIWDHMVWPVSLQLTVAWMVEYILEFALYGIIVGAIYKPVQKSVRAGVAI
ncbi:MAG: hypothetical protein WBC51_22250 [Vicinamibacterales bacterium]